MQEIWKRFVYDLIEAQKAGKEEDSYHRLIEYQFQLLGWAKYKGEICHKSRLSVGHTHIEPDIVIKKDGDVQFVIEVKRPDHKISSSDISQLESYIRQLKIKVGIYIGEHIELFYDKPDTKNALSVLRIPLDLESKLGPQFIELFSKDGFSTDAIVSYCEERLLEKEHQECLNKVKAALIADTNSQVAEALLPYLMKKYNSSFTADDIKSMLAGVLFKAEIKDGATIPAGDDKPSPQPALPPKSDKVWMLCYDKNSFDVEECLHKLGKIYWHYTETTKSISVGDKIYLYSGRSENAIRFEVEVIGDNLPYTPVMDIEDEFVKGGERNQEQSGLYFLVRFVAETHASALTYHEMLKNGVIGHRPTATQLSKPEFKARLDYIETHFSDKGEEAIEFKTYMKKMGGVATMDYYPSSKRYVIKADSRIVDETSKSCMKSVAKLRAIIKADSKLSKKEGTLYRLLQDIELEGVSSPSAAAVFCWGTSRPGPDDWVDKDGNKYTSEWWKNLSK